MCDWCEETCTFCDGGICEECLLNFFRKGIDNSEDVWYNHPVVEEV